MLPELNLVGMIMGNTLNITTVQTEVIEHTIVQSVELTKSALIGAPFAECLTNVHFELLSCFHKRYVGGREQNEQRVFLQHRHAGNAGLVNKPVRKFAKTSALAFYCAARRYAPWRRCNTGERNLPV